MPPAPDLIDDAIAEILLRIPPDEPAHLFRAALVCRNWRRILRDPSFLRRYRVFHGAPPLLGYLYNVRSYAIPSFVSTAAASPLTTLAPSHRKVYRVNDCRHGRVLLRKIGRRQYLIVWDPITGDQKKLVVPKNYPPVYYSAAVLCAVDGCDHLNCHAGPFRVVCCGVHQQKIWVIMYSSDTRAPCSMISIGVDNDFQLGCSTLIGNALYFRHEGDLCMLKYDLGRHELSMIPSPCVRQAIAMEQDDDGGLRFVTVLDNRIYTWSWKTDANNGISGWAQHMVMELETVLPRAGSPQFPSEVIGLVEGTDTIFINVDAGLFTLDLKSRKVKKLGKRVDCCFIKPYMSFYTPDCGRI